MSSQKLLLSLFIPAAVLTTVHAYYYYPFVADDSFISFRYAARLLEGKGLSWTEGRPVEGYSNLLWVLVLAAVKKMTGGAFWVIALVLNYLCSLGSLWLMLRIVGRLTLYNTIALIWSGVLFAISAPIAIWINGGLEVPLVMLLLMAALYCISPALHHASYGFVQMGRAGIWLGLLALARPDGILFTWAISAGLVVLARRLRPLFLLNAIVVLFYAGQLLFRLSYYGEWVPNTALVKIGFTLPRAWEGVLYDGGMLLPFGPMVLASLLYRHSNNRPIRFFFMVITIISLYLAFIGGDIFPGYRHVVPLVPLLCALGSITIMGFQRHMQKTTYYIISVLVLAFVWVTQVKDKRNIDAKRERWEWYSMGLGAALQKGFGQQQPYMATTAAGALPYYAGFSTLDMLGLNDYYLPRHPPVGFGRGFIGHELGDARYFLQQSPDIFIFCGPGNRQPFFYSETSLYNDRRFQQEYSPVLLRYRFAHQLPITYWQAGFHTSIVTDATCCVYIKKNSSTIGVHLDSLHQLIVPAYFFKNKLRPGNLPGMYLGQEGRFVIAIGPGEKYTLDLGRWLDVTIKKEYSENGVDMHIHEGWLDINNQRTEVVEIEAVKIPI